MRDFVILDALGWNWYDLVILAILISGLWLGMRRGLSKLALSTIGVLLILGATVKLYQTIYDWLECQRIFTHDANAPAAILAIAIGGYVPLLIIRWLIDNWLRQHPFPKYIESIGGGILGLVGMAALMAWVNLSLMLSYGPNAQRQFINDSWISSRLVNQLAYGITVANPQLAKPQPAKPR